MLLILLTAGLAVVPLATAAGPPAWRIIIANDTCPDVTWGFTEAQTRQAFAALIGAHLDEMNRTDGGPLENRDHYNATAFIEIEAFLEQHPDRQAELLRRIREGRLCVSPFLCNSLWGFQSAEGALRTFYPARRMEREHGIPIDVAEHIELPSLPWGMASLLPGCGIRWISTPFLDYDCTFKALQNPPLFRLEGPDGSEVRVVMDAWASLKANYMQGGHLLQKTQRVVGEWLPHYQTLGAAYPLRTIFASGTHSDINPASWKQARGFVEGIIQYNAAGTNPASLVNGTLAQFCREVDAVEAKSPFLTRSRGSFGHSWELWPVSLARTVAALRRNERAFLAAEALVALACRVRPDLAASTRADREKAEWFWAMLSDHAWNGTDLKNKRHNAELRRDWAEGLGRLSHELTDKSWQQLGLTPDPLTLTVFNPLSFANNILVVCDAAEPFTGVQAGGRPVAVHRFRDGNENRLLFVAPSVPAFGFREFKRVKGRPITVVPPFRGDGQTLEGPFYSLRLDRRTGGLASLIHKASRQELVKESAGRTLGQPVFSDGGEHLLSDVDSRIQWGAVSGELRVTGRVGELRVTNVITLYAALDRVDFDFRLEKPPTTNEQRWLHFFPIADGVNDLRIEETAAVLRPRLQPAGDLLPGADTRRFAVQGFVDYSPAGRAGVTLVPLDAFMLRLDQGALAFEALGNDQNWKEVTQDQDGARHFRFRYSLRAHAPGYDNAAALAWSRSVAAPQVLARGRLSGKWLGRPHLEVPPDRALVTCLKPADDGGLNQVIVRVWETAGKSLPMTLKIPDYRAARETDLLERERGRLEVRNGTVSVTARAHGFSAVRLE